MAAQPGNSLKFILGAIAVALLGTGGLGFWVWRMAGEAQAGIDVAQADIASKKEKIGQIRKAIEDFEKGGTKEYFHRMMPEAEGYPISHFLRVIQDIEEEAGVFIVSGTPPKRKSAAAGKGPPLPYQEEVITVRIFTDCRGLVRFVEGLEREVDRKSADGGGILFEVKKLKTVQSKDSEEEEGEAGGKQHEAKGGAAVTVPFVPGWKYFDIDVATFTLSGKKK